MHASQLCSRYRMLCCLSLVMCAALLANREALYAGTIGLNAVLAEGGKLSAAAYA